jgi:ATP-dependent DNA ligase
MFEFRLPIKSSTVQRVPIGFKYNGSRLWLERDGGRVRLIIRGDYNWTSRYSWIVESALKNRYKKFVIDGEAAFDLLVEGGDDLRKLPLHLRKASLERLLARRPEGIFVNPFERGEVGPVLFRAACKMGLEGLVSKRRDRRYQPGRLKHWFKVKNRKHPAMERVMDVRLVG